MKFKPGDKVWMLVIGGDSSIIAPGNYAAAIAASHCSAPSCWFNGQPGYWVVDVEGHYMGGNFHAHENCLIPRDDPPPAQEPKREATGQWDSCVWKPSREEALT